VLEGQYRALKERWERLEFAVVPYRNEVPRTKNACVLTELDELFGNFDDLLVSFSNILGSRHLKLLREEVDALQKRVFYCQETVDEWLAVQKNWIYLESIFASTDIKNKLKDDSAAFEGVDKFFQKQMTLANKTKLVHRSIKEMDLRNWRKNKEVLSNI